MNLIVFNKVIKNILKDKKLGVIDVIVNMLDTIKEKLLKCINVFVFLPISNCGLLNLVKLMAFFLINLTKFIYQSVGDGIVNMLDLIKEEF